MSSRKQDYPEDKWNGMYVDASAEVPDAVAERPAGDWFVLIEETVGGTDRQRWSLTEEKPFVEREKALHFAADLARRYEPRHPARERARRIYRTGDDVWTVAVDGAMSRYHFRISVARLET